MQLSNQFTVLISSSHVQHLLYHMHSLFLIPFKFTFLFEDLYFKIMIYILNNMMNNYTFEQFSISNYNEFIEKT